MIENIEDDVIREFMIIGFNEIFQNHQSIPVGILIDPILIILQKGDNPYQFNVFDFEFFS